eukprot:CAMPEP_0172507256 /NCGR_PEP_ID=MMETSP1066-20121228/202588_1 /TAXON_ID=671091 /ORGANISM="Coscinodiscus wailesii, Strain CCMP2513" /LENGTH=338 /DNA_ID=CAMNT_0013284747 /DNA_START=211 /DNA_END=1227 /DNA_ORIENTATION=-
MVYLEYYNTRFWRCEHTSAKTVAITYGKCGSDGRTVVKKDFENENEANKYIERRIKYKMIDGYIDTSDPKPMNNSIDINNNDLMVRSSKCGKRNVTKFVDSSHIVVDSGVARIDEMLASKMEVYNDFSARLALVDSTNNKDVYFTMQVLVDCKKKKRRVIVDSDTHLGRFYVFCRWGATGTNGDINMDGPFDVGTAVRQFKATFHSKTGNVWSNNNTHRCDKDSEARVGVGKYEFMPPIIPKQHSKWYYYLTFDPLGKPDGWYEYDRDNACQAEVLYADFEHSNRAARFSTRLVHSRSSGFTYSVNLENMTQRNTSSGTIRPIERTTNGLPPSMAPNV